jgi:hypothetical protein
MAQLVQVGSDGAGRGNGCVRQVFCLVLRGMDGSVGWVPHCLVLGIIDEQRSVLVNGRRTIACDPPDLCVGMLTMMLTVQS